MASSVLLKRVFRELIAFRRSVIFVLTPIALLPLILEYDNQACKCAYVLILMAVYWITETLPLAVTSFLPVVLFPLLGVLPASRTSANYLKDVNFLFIGGLMMALATEESNLHKRLALRVLVLMGSQPRWLLFGFMSITAFLSMWMSNTATTAMMVPIAVAVVEEVTKYFGVLEAMDEEEPMTTSSKKSEQLDENIKLNLNEIFIEENGGVPPAISNEAVKAQKEEMFNDPYATITSIKSAAFSLLTKLDKVSKTRRKSGPENKLEGCRMDEFHELPESLQNICKTILYGICVAANLGGTGTLTGSGPNLVLNGQLNLLYPNQTDVTFATWLAFGIPSMVICLLLSWLWIQLFFLGFRRTFGMQLNPNRRKSYSTTVFRSLSVKYEELGVWTFAELSVVFWFVILVFFWVFRDPHFVPGWTQWLNLNPGYVSDSCAAMVMGCLLFAWPNQVPDFICWRKDKSKKPKNRKSLITWGAMQHKFPWGVIFLLGGGFAIADGVQVSGLAHWMGCTMQESLQHLSPSMIMFVFICFTTAISEITSNSATASIFIPILLSVSEALHVNPLYFCLPATVAASFAFMLPVATPPNAIIYECKIVSLKEMVFCGFFIDLMCIGVTTFSVNTFTWVIFNLATYPNWAFPKNANETCDI